MQQAQCCRSARQSLLLPPQRIYHVQVLCRVWRVSLNTCGSGSKITLTRAPSARLSGRLRIFSGAATSVQSSSNSDCSAGKASRDANKFHSDLQPVRQAEIRGFCCVQL